jgi:uncharacterized protein (DUF2062 family)
MKKLNITKIVKGIIFVAIGVVFLFVSFYNIVPTTIILNEGFENTNVGFTDVLIYLDLQDYWNEFFKPNIINFVLSGLFILLGLIEFKEAFTDGS